MRLFLLPISTRRTLIYCERMHEKLASERSYLDKITNKANETWALWEKDSKSIANWKKTVTVYGNKAFKRIPFEEWGLKTVPALTAKRRKLELEGKEKVEVIFPRRFVHEERVPGILRQLATERQALHKKRMIGSIAAMPFSAPFMLIPVVPNIPFFYLVFRAYSHWKALTGSKHLQFILENKLLKPVPSSELDEAYAAGLMYPTRELSRAAPLPTQEQVDEISNIVGKQTNDGSEDVMVLQRWNGKLIAERFKLPEMEIEIERAVEQVETAIKGKEELLEEKRELERATASPDSVQTEEPADKKTPSEKFGETLREKKSDVSKT
ncbi:hypothetical protein BU16DRAFT_449143 [Lophium mytilinum]|uniref:Mitochondrial K+-H+ exchange-related-domain-containing protein n=1 Tax=Lophium mytilinum TaxID=390894 RepID=A0A6A6RIK9_9PEZI|nr:hypothetical protein BU16DRAFT_449143 [Lophium mytilinum]